ncbi:MAG TPA: hypothetical protein VIY70_12325 [Acidimicrobiia bacterium]
MKRAIAVALALTLSGAGCTGDDDTVELTTTTTTAPSAGAPGTTASTDATTDDTSDEGSSSSTSTSVPGEAVSEFDVVVTTAAEDGDRLWVVIPPGNYGTVDLENFVLDFLEGLDEPLLELHVFDDRSALDAGRVDPASRTAEEQALVERHYLLSVTEGVRVEFHGPYGGESGFTYGS